MRSKEAKEQFVEYMRLYESALGHRILTYCIMDNHFHILIEVPSKVGKSLTDEQLIERITPLYSNDYINFLRSELRTLSATKTDEGRAAYKALREKFTRRMWDLGSYMKTLKQVFSTWYNQRHGRRGTLWEGRYRNSIVEPGEPLQKVAAYIDLNPVRAGITDKAESYRWSGYGVAVSRDKDYSQLARNGLARVMSAELEGCELDGWEQTISIEKCDWRSLSGKYRLKLYLDGASFGPEREKAMRRAGFSEEELKREIAREGQLSVAEIASVQSRYFIESGIIGSKAFVSRAIRKLRGDFISESHVGEAVKPQGHMRYSGLWTLRNLCEEDKLGAAKRFQKRRKKAIASTAWVSV